jgi:endonuclease G
MWLPWPSSFSGEAKRSNRFYEDPDVPKHLRASLNDYKKSGYDRGHIAAAGNHKSNQSEMDETFLLSNMCPQVGKGFNRGAWKNLEERVRNVVAKNIAVDVISAPLYLPDERTKEVRYPVIGRNCVSVPTHFYKVLIAENARGRRKRSAYIMPNRIISKNESLKSFESSVEKVERLAGIIIL